MFPVFVFSLLLSLVLPARTRQFSLARRLHRACASWAHLAATWTQRAPPSATSGGRWVPPRPARRSRSTTITCRPSRTCRSTPTATAPARRGPPRASCRRGPARHRSRSCRSLPARPSGRAATEVERPRMWYAVILNCAAANSSSSAVTVAWRTPSQCSKRTALRRVIPLACRAAGTACARCVFMYFVRHCTLHVVTLVPCAGGHEPARPACDVHCRGALTMAVAVGAHLKHTLRGCRRITALVWPAVMLPRWLWFGALSWFLMSLFNAVHWAAHAKRTGWACPGSSCLRTCWRWSRT